MFTDQLDALFFTPYDNLWTRDQTFSVRLEARNGLYTLYINGALTESSQLVSKGNNVGFVVFAAQGEQSVSFDNLVVRDDLTLFSSASILFARFVKH